MQYDNGWSEDRRVQLRSVQGEVELPGVKILPQGSRAGHTERQKAVDHIEKMTKLGYIDDAESAQRQKLAADATKHGELKQLISDLPGYTARKKLFAGWNWDEQSCWLPALIVCLIGSVATMVVPVALVASTADFSTTGWKIIVAVLGLVWGLVGVVASISGLVVKGDK